MLALLVFLAAIAGVFIGRYLLPTRGAPQADLHDVLHREIGLSAEQDRQLHAMETGFSARRRQLEAELRADNARIAAAIATEHHIGPEVSAAVDTSHRTMGELQKETLAHIFAMRAVLRPEQARAFDAAVIKALTDDTQ